MRKIFFILMVFTCCESNAENTNNLPRLGSDDPFCSPEVQGVISYTTSVTNNFIPYGLASVIGETAAFICPSQVEQRLNKLDARIDILEDRVNKLEDRMEEAEFDISKLTNYVNSQMVMEYIKDYIKEAGNFDAYIQSYRIILLKNKYTSFRDFSDHAVDKNGNGGFKNLYEDSTSNFGAMMKSSAALVKQLQDIMPLRPNADRLMEYLNTLCRNVKSDEPGDVVELRTFCNRVIYDIVTIVNIRSQEAKLVLLDYIDTVNAAYNSGNIDDEWFNLGGKDLVHFNNSQIKLKDATEVAKQITDKYSADIRKIFIGDITNTTNPNGKMFPLYDGLANYELIKKACLASGANPGSRQDAEDHTSILEWYPSGANGSLPYVMTNCPMKTALSAADIRNGDPYIEYVKSKYYLTESSSINNILGVLVPANATKLNSASVRLVGLYLLANPQDTIQHEFKFTIRSNLPLHKNSTTATNSFNKEMQYVPAYLSVVPPDERYKTSQIPVYAWYEHYTDMGKNNPGKDYPAANGPPPDSSGNVGLVTMSTQVDLSPYLYYNSSITNVAHKLEQDGGTWSVFGLYDEVVYFSFKRDGITYPFGFRITNRIVRDKHTLLFVDNKLTNLAIEDVNLQCLDKNQCSAVDNKITWKDGTHISMEASHNTSNMWNYPQVNLTIGRN